MSGANLRTAAIHLGLFAVTCVTTTWFGGPAFAATLMAILTCHELGHYVAARWHRVPVSLPYFIPLPPQISLGTLGAVIRMDTPIANRNHLFDVGVAGPIAGLVVALPLLVIGLSLSTVGPVAPGAMLEGNSILYGLVKLVMFGRWLPSGGDDVQLHPMAFAAWVGLLITMINLLPIGQLDGGHVARGYLGERHERLSATLHRVLPVMGALVCAVMAALAWVAGQTIGQALQYGVTSALPWLIWTAMIALMRRGGDGRYHPPTDDVPLTAGRRWLAYGMLVVFMLIFMPVPMRTQL